MTQSDTAPTAQTIGQQLRAMRKARFPADTQDDMAVRVGVSRRTYQRMERGDMSVSLKHYLEAASILGCLKSFNELFTTSDEPTGLLATMLAKSKGGSGHGT
ncbi:MAG: helix-turn-helix transcriptional regulator [Cellvibrionaceae bacterium]